MPTTDNMSLELPAEDGSSGTWDTLLNAALTVLDEHDHTTGNGLPIPSAGIDIDADLPFGGFAATGLKAIDFDAVASSTIAALSRTLFVDSGDDELYWRTSTGVNVQLTDGTSLNSALLGGFTGDYGSGDEEAEYTSGSSIYNFLKNATTRAYIDSSDLRLFEATSGITNAVKLKSPASLAASYTLTMPAALPSSTTKLLKFSTTGVGAFTGTAEHEGNLTQTGTLAVTGATTLQSTLGVTGTTTLSGVATVGGTLGVTGAATLSSTLGVAGLITATSGLTAAANQHVTVSGTGRFKHGAESITIPATDGITVTPATDTTTYGNTQAANTLLSRMDVTLTAGTEKLRIPIKLPVGRRITEVAVEFSGAGGGTKRFNVFKAAAGAPGTSLGVTTSTSTTTGASGLIALGVTDHTMVSGEVVWFQFDGADAGDIVYHIVVSYDFP